MKDLIQLGFTEKEARIYIACLELGRGSVVDLCRASGVAKSTTADILRSFAHRQLVTVHLKKSRRVYVASDPAVLKERAHRTEEALEGIFPELQALYGEGARKPRMRFYEGKEGLRFVLNEMLEEAKSIISVNSIEDTFSKLSEYFPDFSQKRVKRGIPIRIIARDCPIARERQRLGPKELRTIQIRQTLIQFRSAMFAWGDKVAMITLKEDCMIVVVESRDIAQMFSAMFEWLWDEPATDAK